MNDYSSSFLNGKPFAFKRKLGYQMGTAKIGHYLWENRNHPAHPVHRSYPLVIYNFKKAIRKAFAAYQSLGTATAESGPLKDKMRALVKLALAVGGQMEGAVHSHTRRALEAGCTPDEIRHVVLLGTTTLGFPTMIKTLSWVDDVLGQE